ncbi:MAG: Spo0E family sporulation regulatory protein-aspartic acid phosphatase [Bacillota bacterium]
MVQGIDERLESLRAAIEELREELHSEIARDNGRLDGARTCEISESLDKLVAQFLRVKEKLEEERGSRDVTASRQRLTPACPKTDEY